ncbi:putative G2/M phase checkpoint control protein Sum2 [Phyllosticta citribraziliensis]|uniref:G2/M phase checkpoint control protein Sum2 n=1 Tax=Phyllosticta citribraziliensis TaxID=989973 RepID=A0ABR1LFC6_9PEZI
MSEYIGAQISLISKSDIRYVGTLHEINSENSTVALENVTSFGTEGRRNGEDEIPASDNIYEYIVFRGSDVKDLRIEDKVEQPKPAPPPMPNDPAILGAARPPQSTPHNQQQQTQPPNFPQHFNPPYPTSGPGPYPPFNNQRFGPPGGPPGGYPGGPGGPGGFPGYPGMPYGAPPGWYPPPGQGFPPGPPGPFSGPHAQMPIGPPGPNQKPGEPSPIGPNKDAPQKPVEADAAPKAEVQAKSKTSTPASGPGPAPTPPVESKPDPAAAMAPAHSTAAQSTAAQSTVSAGPKGAPTGPKSNRIVPAVPLATPGQRPAAPTAAPQPSASQSIPAATGAVPQYQAATAAVAAAMAKLKPQGAAQPTQAKPDNDSAMQNLTQKVAEMRADDKIRHGKQPGTGGFAAGYRGGRAPRRGGFRDQQVKPVEVPTTDFDFETSNAKFNKQDLVKEAIATGSPVGTPGEEPESLNGTNGTAEKEKETVVIPGAPYNRTTSFFDNISSELKDREDARGRLGGQEFRNEERKKNLETFGQGSVDNYRGGYRGRGRGRGYRGGRGFGRGRGGGGRGRGPSAPLAEAGAS